MTQALNPTYGVGATTNILPGFPQIPGVFPSPADVAFIATQNANAALACSAVVNIFTATGGIDAKKSAAYTAMVQSIVVILTPAVLAANGLTPAAWGNRIDWNATNIARQAQAAIYSANNGQ